VGFVSGPAAHVAVPLRLGIVLDYLVGFVERGLGACRCDQDVADVTWATVLLLSRALQTPATQPNTQRNRPRVMGARRRIVVTKRKFSVEQIVSVLKRGLRLAYLPSH